jgi:hypothetical protein
MFVVLKEGHSPGLKVDPHGSILPGSPGDGTASGGAPIPASPGQNGSPGGSNGASAATSPNGHGHSNAARKAARASGRMSGAPGHARTRSQDEARKLRRKSSERKKKAPKRKVSHSGMINQIALQFPTIRNSFNRVQAVFNKFHGNHSFIILHSIHLIIHSFDLDLTHVLMCYNNNR